MASEHKAAWTQLPTRRTIRNITSVAIVYPALGTYSRKRRTAPSQPLVLSEAKRQQPEEAHEAEIGTHVGEEEQEEEEEEHEEKSAFEREYELAETLAARFGDRDLVTEALRRGQTNFFYVWGALLFDLDADLLVRLRRASELFFTEPSTSPADVAARMAGLERAYAALASQLRTAFNTLGHLWQSGVLASGDVTDALHLLDQTHLLDQVADLLWRTCAQLNQQHTLMTRSSGTGTRLTDASLAHCAWLRQDALSLATQAAALADASRPRGLPRQSWET